MRRVTRIAAVVVLGACVAQAFADPPAHAPAHGWRKKHDPYYVGYTGTKWERDYDVSSGSCNRQEIGAVLGGVAGGVIGSKVTSPGNRPVGIIIGAVAGALLGARIGRELDDSDRGCFGHTLEIAGPGQHVSWTNPTTGVRFVLTPQEGQREAGGTCRNFTLEAVASGQKSKRTGKACQTSPGIWQLT